MLKLQEKLFFRSTTRIIILMILLVGGLIYHIRLGVIGIDGAVTYGPMEHYVQSIFLFVLYFIILLFLSFDYFREIPDADLLEIARSSRTYLKNDCLQMLVMLQWIMAYAVMQFIFSIVFFGQSGVLTIEIFWYFCRFVFLYIILNGLIAVLLGWFLARTVGKLIGYVCIILFSCMVSPILTSQLGWISMLFNEIYGYFQAFLIMPEGLDAWNDFTLFPVNLSLAARALVWVFLFLLGLINCYRLKRRKIMSAVCMVGAVWAIVYMNLPTSFYCSNSSYGVTDSIAYDQMTYMINGAEEKYTEVDYKVKAYQMNLKMGRQMRAAVTLYPDIRDLTEYEMTLYHLYKVDKVTDENGRRLDFERSDDYLKVKNSEGDLTAIYVEYHGGCSNFYSNRNEINLPGWFAYYPMPGYREIYQDYEYVDNRFDYKVDFDIVVESHAKVYSDIERTEGNHFCGNGYGPTLLSGFVKEVELENGVTCVFPYLYKMYDPMAEVAEEYCAEVLADLEQDSEWTAEERKTILFLPNLAGDGALSLRGGSYTGCEIWRWLAKNYQETGSIVQ